jgi:hypothetical protein
VSLGGLFNAALRGEQLLARHDEVAVGEQDTTCSPEAGAGCDVDGPQECLVGSGHVAVAGVAGGAFFGGSVSAFGEVAHPYSTEVSPHARLRAAFRRVLRFGRHGVSIARTPTSLSGFATRWIVCTMPPDTSRTMVVTGVPS